MKQQKLAREASRVKDPFPLPDYRSSRFARLLFFSAYFPLCGTWSQAFPGSFYISVKLPTYDESVSHLLLTAIFFSFWV